MGIDMQNGEMFSTDCYNLKGSPQNPAGVDALIKKFKSAAIGLLTSFAI